MPRLLFSASGILLLDSTSKSERLFYEALSPDRAAKKHASINSLTGKAPVTLTTTGEEMMLVHPVDYLITQTHSVPREDLSLWKLLTSSLKVNEMCF